MMEQLKMLLQGNEALARGIVESGCTVAASYPGTPASEILTAVQAYQHAEGLPMHNCAESFEARRLAPSPPEEGRGEGEH